MHVVFQIKDSWEMLIILKDLNMPKTTFLEIFKIIFNVKRVLFNANGSQYKNGLHNQFYFSFHTKIKILTIYSPSSCSKTVWVFSSIFQTIGNLTADDSHRLPYYEKKYYASQWLPSTVWSPVFFQISSFIFLQKKETHRFETTCGSKLWKYFPFLVNYHFKQDRLCV